MLQPFTRLAAAHAQLDDLLPPIVRDLDLDARVPLRESQSALEVASGRLRDDRLGLKVGRSFCFGMGGAFDYAVRSASTVRDSVEIAQRYSRLIAEPLSITLDIWRSYAFIRLEDEVPWSPVLQDFAMSTWFRNHVVDEIPAEAGVECWFPRSTPADISQYEETFPGALLRFNAPFLGFAFKRAYENAPMPVADPVLHSMLCARADSLVAAIKASSAFAPIVRRLITQAIRDAEEPTLALLARTLHLSRRTLCRKLVQEGTTFTDELDATRRELAMAYVRQPELEMTEIAFRLGFSHVESFYRAFRRWTGATPLGYRRAAE
jgi:AraC-like DNA-binding protein